MRRRRLRGRRLRRLRRRRRRLRQLLGRRGRRTRLILLRTPRPDGAAAPRRPVMKHFLGPVGFLLVSLTAGAAPAADVKALVRTIDAVGPEGAGIAEAARAWRELSRLPAADLPKLLAAFDGASPTAANWLCAAVDAVVHREKTAGRSLPKSDLESFLNDQKHSGR